MKKLLKGPDGAMHLYPRYWMFPSGQMPHLKVESPGAHVLANYDFEGKAGNPIKWRLVGYTEAMAASRCGDIKENPSYEEPGSYDMTLYGLYNERGELLSVKVSEEEALEQCTPETGLSCHVIEARDTGKKIEQRLVF
jgi:hypothetical protein